MIEIDLLALAIAIAPMLVVAWITQRWSDRAWEIGWASLRMLVQLLAAGFALTFIFAADSPWIGLAVIAVMIAVSSLIAVRLVERQRLQAFWRATIGVGLGGGAVLCFVLFAVLGLSDPWYRPRVIIPIAGMVFSNAMTAVTLAAERLQRELDGEAAFEAARAAAWRAALIPQINALLAVGLVALPGVMTGQILAGVDPLIAVRYQIVIMAMIMQSAAFAVALYLMLSRPRSAA